MKVLSDTNNLEYRAEYNHDSINIDKYIVKECIDNNVGVLFANIYSNKSLKLDNAEWYLLKTYFEEEAQISVIISFVQVMKSYDAFRIFSDIHYADLMEIACKRYKNEYLDKDTFSHKSLTLFEIFTKYRYKIWMSTITKHIKEVKDPYPWIYLIIKPKEEHWEINNEIREGLSSCVTPSIMSILSNRQDINQEIIKDFHEIMNSPSTIKDIVEKEHIFLKQARLWWNAHPNVSHYFNQ